MSQRKTSKGGRPALPAGMARKNRIMVNVTEDERDAIERAAKDEPLGAFIRRIVLRYVARRRR